MNPFSYLFTILLIQPFFNIVVGLYALLSDVAFAIIGATIILKLVLYPVNKKIIVSQVETQEKVKKIQGSLKQLQEKYKNDPMRFNQEMQNLYKEVGFNPFASMGPLLLQTIVLFAFYKVFILIPSPDNLSMLYSFMPHITQVSMVTFWGVDFAAKNNNIFIGLLAVANFLQIYLSQRRMQQISPQPKGTSVFAYAMVLLIVFISSQFNTAFILYWLVSSIITIIQQELIYRHILKNQKT